MQRQQRLGEQRAELRALQAQAHVGVHHEQRRDVELAVGQHTARRLGLLLRRLFGGCAEGRRQVGEHEALAGELAGQVRDLLAAVELEIAAEAALADIELRDLQRPHVLLLREVALQRERRGGRQRDAQCVTHRRQRRAGQRNLTVQPFEAQHVHRLADELRLGLACARLQRDRH